MTSKNVNFPSVPVQFVLSFSRCDYIRKSRWKKKLCPRLARVDDLWSEGRPKMATHDFSIQDVDKVITGIDGEIKKVDITRLTPPGENYLSLMFLVDFEVEKDGKTKTISTVAKRLPLEEKEFGLNAVVMQHEIGWYSEMVPLLKKFAEEINLDIDYYPDYLGGRFSMDATKTHADDESVLLLHNLIPEGYKNEDRYVGFDLNSAKAVLSTLANFHAVPLVMKYKRPDLLETFKEFLDTCAHNLEPIYRNFANACVTLLEKDDPDAKYGPPGEGEPPKGALEDLLYDALLEDPKFQSYKEKVKTLKNKPHGPATWHRLIGTEPWKTVVHNDFWVNNIMVKSREENAPLVKMVDFQFTTYSSYAHDVVLFLLTSIRNDVMKQHFEDLLRHYYEKLTSIIENAGVSELKLTYEEYLEELKRMARECELNHAIFWSSFVFGKKGDVPDILTGEIDMISQMANMAKNISDKQKERLMTVLELAEAKGWI